MHTPGPWVTGRLGEGMCLEVFRESVSMNNGIASAWHTDPGTRKQIEGESNARLISAAPEMLNILKSLGDGAIDSLYDESEAQYIRSVISKAEGR